MGCGEWTVLGPSGALHTSFGDGTWVVGHFRPATRYPVLFLDKVRAGSIDPLLYLLGANFRPHRTHNRDDQNRSNPQEPRIKAHLGYPPSSGNVISQNILRLGFTMDNVAVGPLLATQGGYRIENSTGFVSLPNIFSSIRQKRVR